MRRSIALLAAIAVGCLALPANAASRTTPGVAPPQSHPHGLTYGEWAARWWQWALETPFSVHPLLDFLTGADCSVGQQGRVWFLGGTFAIAPGVERDCTVPTGTALFFPIINAGYFAFLDDPPEQRTEEFVRAQVACGDYVLAAEIDGVPVDMPERYLELSPLFEVNLPDDNILGIEPQLLSPSVDQGVYLFVRPLPVGEHTIHFSGTQTCPFGSFVEQVTYRITVPPANRFMAVPLN